MSSSQQLYYFGQHWRTRRNFEILPVGNYVFPALVTYEYSGKSMSGLTTCTVIRNGYEDGKISLEEKGVLSSTIFHLDFKDDFQTYKFDESTFALVVSGNSQKMGGSYKVTILPQ
jgi:hypothetical protein